jgi:hypothetical protein
MHNVNVTLNVKTWLVQSLRSRGFWCLGSFWRPPLCRFDALNCPAVFLVGTTRCSTQRYRHWLSTPPSGLPRKDIWARRALAFSCVLWNDSSRPRWKRLPRRTSDKCWTWSSSQWQESQRLPPGCSWTRPESWQRKLEGSLRTALSFRLNIGISKKFYWTWVPFLESIEAETFGFYLNPKAKERSKSLDNSALFVCINLFQVNKYIY